MIFQAVVDNDFIKDSNQQEQRKYRHRLIQQFFKCQF